ncbi:unannotated protein [freshwater metagenome]|uniref:Unannotated protein n=1 Tax=freshwater metagenome TaxID=449393 RepID=A0A6J7MQ64_9ZZZZ
MRSRFNLKKRHQPPNEVAMIGRLMADQNMPEINKYLRRWLISFLRHKMMMMGSSKTIGKNLVEIDTANAIALSSYFLLSK